MVYGLTKEHRQTFGICKRMLRENKIHQLNKQNKKNKKN